MLTSMPIAACQSNETELDWGDDLITIASNFRVVLDIFEWELKTCENDSTPISYSLLLRQ
jgi:hypothetical protein